MQQSPMQFATTFWHENNIDKEMPGREFLEMQDVTLICQETSEFGHKQNCFSQKCSKESLELNSVVGESRNMWSREASRSSRMFWKPLPHLPRIAYRLDPHSPTVSEVPFASDGKGSKLMSDTPIFFVHRNSTE